MNIAFRKIQNQIAKSTIYQVGILSGLDTPHGGHRTLCDQKFMPETENSPIPPKR